MTKIILNGREVEVDPKKPLIHACHEHGANVPMYCYHPGLTPVGSCRICQVEVRQGEQPARVVVACRTPVAEGMVVDTRAPKAIETRNAVRERLWALHIADRDDCAAFGKVPRQVLALDPEANNGNALAGVGGGQMWGPRDRGFAASE